jgi:hypothetical protein
MIGHKYGTNVSMAHLLRKNYSPLTHSFVCVATRMLLFEVMMLFVIAHRMLDATWILASRLRH